MPAPPWGHQPVPVQGAPLPPHAGRSGSAWLVVLPIGVAVVLLALVGLGLRAAGGRTPDPGTVEVPARADALPRTSTTTPGTSRGSSTTQPGGSTTTTPGTSGSPTPTLDTTTPRVKVADAEGRFDITVPRSWVSLPGVVPSSIAWQLFEQDAAGDPVRTEFQFIVAWFASDGCDLEACAAQQADRLTSGQPNVTVTKGQATVGGLPAVRLEAASADQRLVDWVVVKGDRYWVVQLVGPMDGFDDVLSTVQPALATMSFG